MGKIQYIFLIIGVILLILLVILVQSEFHATITSQTPMQKTFALKLKQNQLESGPQIITVTQGDTVKITIFSDRDQEFHLHGYNKMVDITASHPAILRFIANMTGHFTYELEQQKLEIGAVDVLPR